MRKSSILIVVLVLVALITTSCSSKTGSIGNEEGDARSADKKVKIEYWHVNSDTQGGQTVEELVKRFNEKNAHIEVIAVYNPDMYKGLMQNFQAEASSGNPPAVVQVGWAFLDYFSNNFEYVTPQKIIDNYCPEDKDFLKDNFLENVLNLSKNSKGENAGIAYSLSTPVLYYNKDIFKEAGLPEKGPETWEQVIDYAKIIKQKTGNYGIYIQEPADFWAQQAILESNGARMLTNKDGKIRASFASQEGIEAFTAYADMVLKDKSALHISWDEGMQSFASGDIGMAYTTIARRASIQEQAKFDVGAVKSPVWEGKERAVPAGGCFLAITAKDEEQQKAAWEFMKFLYSIESMAEWTIGTGYVPPRKNVAEAEDGLKNFLKENELMTPAIEQMNNVRQWASFPGDAGLIAEQKLLDMREQILNGTISPEEVMKKTQDEINELLE